MHLVRHAFIIPVQKAEPLRFVALRTRIGIYMLDYILLFYQLSVDMHIGYSQPATHTHTHTHTHRLQNCEHFLTDSLMKSWDLYVIEERSMLTAESAQKDGKARSLTGTLWQGVRSSKKRKGLAISSETMVQVRVHCCQKSNISHVVRIGIQQLLFGFNITVFVLI